MTVLLKPHAYPLRRPFHLGSIPRLSLWIVGLWIGIYLLWQESLYPPTDALLQHGAKSRATVWELHEYWRLFTANFLHASPLHLLGNAFFLFHVGVAFEAAFSARRCVSIVTTAALMSTTLSLYMNPGTTCGGSGIVFGVWTATALFGWHARRRLSPRYRRYFLFALIPYGAFAMYAASLFPTTDTWGHLGGALGGVLGALSLQSTTSPIDRHDPLARNIVAALACTLFLAWPRPTHPPDFAPEIALHIPKPVHWSSLLHGHRRAGFETYAYGNDAGVGVGVEAQPLTPSMRQGDPVAWLEQSRLTHQLDQLAPKAFKLHRSETVRVGRLQGRYIRTQIFLDDRHQHADFVIIDDRDHRHVISLTTPAWLYPRYAPAFRRMLEDLRRAQEPGV